MRHVRYAIIGGGISGSTLLHLLALRGEDVLLLEREDGSGGVIRSERFAGGLIERGPNTLLTGNEHLAGLIDELGLNEAMVTADPAARNRYVLRGGRLLAVPTSPRSLVESPLLSGRGKLRLLREFFLGGSKSMNGNEESVASFVERRFGREPLAYGVDPFVSGIYAGDPALLSLRHTFPMLPELEKEYGSVFKGMMRKGKERRRRGETRSPRIMFSFQDGLQAIPRAIEERWEEQMVRNAGVTLLEREGEGWRLEFDSGKGEDSVRAENVILATNAPAAARLLAPVDKKLADTLRRIVHAPVAVVHLLYDPPTVGHRLDGFGLLVPSVEKRDILGVIFSSTIFPSRSPEGKALLTVFIGGRRRPELTRLEEKELARLAHREVADILSVASEPVASQVTVWSTGIPQYEIGYGQILQGIEEGEARLPGLHLLGSYRGGVSVPDCVKSAYELAETLLNAS